jgi:hypothetical protein
MPIFLLPLNIKVKLVLAGHFKNRESCLSLIPFDLVKIIMNLAFLPLVPSFETARLAFVCLEDHIRWFLRFYTVEQKHWSLRRLLSHYGDPSEHLNTVILAPCEGKIDRLSFVQLSKKNSTNPHTFSRHGHTFELAIIVIRVDEDEQGGFFVITLPDGQRPSIIRNETQFKRHLDYVYKHYDDLQRQTNVSMAYLNIQSKKYKCFIS